MHPDYQRQLSKFASVQDRLREWKPSVMAKLQVFACMTIQALDVDAIRSWMRKCSWGGRAEI